MEHIYIINDKKEHFFWATKNLKYLSKKSKISINVLYNVFSRKRMKQLETNTHIIYKLKLEKNKRK